MKTTSGGFEDRGKGGSQANYRAPWILTLKMCVIFVSQELCLTDVRAWQ